ncbi:nucleoside-diphosphate sugar epimerase/dehydratase [Altererythrobacter sp. ZODW24]|uniref:polysaccharide biosynthesis protein n=1 Tax=Altererythrobacter sp. ZODW24 TaxID=2185142 RepID=UPI000DF801D5|nr:nucleoside-diphosphate sugar epimerase/dehydratase [Altererythrobacter sp. ZODW24]
MIKSLFAALSWFAGWPRGRKQLVVILGDMTLCFLAALIAWTLRMEYLTYWNDGIGLLLAVALPASVAVFWITGVYRAVFRFAGMGMMATLARSFAFYGLVVAGIFSAIGIAGVPRSLGIMQPIIFFGLVALSRITARYLFLDLLGRGKFRGEIRHVLIYGAGTAGQQLAASIASEPSMRLIGYIDDDKRLDGQKLDGIRVYSAVKLAQVTKSRGATDLFLAIPRLSRAERRAIVERLEDHPLHVQTLPQMTDLVEGKITINEIRDLDIQDLLGREPVAPNELLLGRTVVGKTVLVTGAGGSIGSELCRRIATMQAARLLLYERSEFALYSIESELRQFLEESGANAEIIPLLGSVTDAPRLDYVFSTYHPDTVYHAAAYKHVPLVEANPVEGIRNNVFGTLEAVRAAEKFEVSDFILISTDKAVRPTNIMGTTKRCAELVLQSYAERGGPTKYSMVRFGNVLGSSGSVVPLFRQQIAAGGPITLTHKDVTRYFMTIPEAADLVIQAAGLAKGGEVFVLDMGEPVRIGDLAETMIRLSGLTVKTDADSSGDIAITEVGLRPGEKLYEELLIGNDPIGTTHERIFMAREAFLSRQELEPILNELTQCRGRDEAIALLERLVPEFAQEKISASDCA